MCGEKRPARGNVSAPWGSPPRVRGKEFWGCCCAGCHRITPACAGKSCNLSGVLCQFRDHPRVCGEKSGKLSLAHRSKGSPPRVRGKVKTPQKGLQRPRITPACAGKREIVLPFLSHIRDHPRVCGEKIVGFGSAKSKKGSPPRVRGKEKSGMSGSETKRITPACAGKRTLS